MSSLSLWRALADFTRIPLLSPRLVELGIRGVVTLPTMIFLTHSFYYYADFLQAQSTQFYNSSVVDTFDFIVVGGGSGGAVVANRLSLHSRVLLLELGGDPHPLSFIPISASLLQRAPSTDLMYETLPQNSSCFGLKNRVMFWPRGTGIGGSSNLNFMIYQRGHPKDYDNWAKITQNPVWEYKNLLKYFKRLEDYHGAYPNSEFHGVGGPMHIEKSRQTYMGKYFLNAAKEKGFPIHDTNAAQGEGFGELDVSNMDGLRWSTYPAYIEPILQRKNLIISRYSRVIKVHLDSSRHAYGVTYYRHGIRKFVRARREVILSGGAVDTPKLLLLSSIGPIRDLHSLGLKCRVNLGVGNNLQDHLFSLVGPFVFKEGVHESLHPVRDLNLDGLIRFTSNGTGPLASITTISSLGFINSNATRAGESKEDWPDIQFFQMGFGIPGGFGPAFEHISNMRPSLVNDFLRGIVGRDSNTILQVLVRPKSRGWIKLRGRNPLLKPLIQPNYFSNKQDLIAMVQGMKWMVNLYENTSTYGELGAELNPTPLGPCSHLEWKSDAYYACFLTTITQTLYHPVGTTPMGRDDYYTNPSARNETKEGDWPIPVVDSHLRVFKTSGLRVVDASVMPIIVNSNTNIPTVMIGEVGSDLIREYWTLQSEVCPHQPILYFSKHSQLDQNQCTYTKIY